MSTSPTHVISSPRHPPGLYTLFFTEMWERCSYYGMRGLLVLFMKATLEKGGLEFSIPMAGAIYGLYTAAVYLAALGNLMAGLIAGESTSPGQMSSQFWWIALSAAGIAVLLMFLAKPMRRWMAGIN